MPTIGRYNINASIIQTIENLYKFSRAVLFNGSTNDWFRTTARLEKDAYSPSTLCYICLERILSEVPDDQKDSNSIGDRTRIYFRSLGAVVVNAEEKEKNSDIFTSMDTTLTRYKMEIDPH